MKSQTFFAAGAAALFFGLATGALAKDSKDPAWMAKKPADWKLEDTTDILNNSAWVQSVDVIADTLVPADTKGTSDAPAKGQTNLYIRWWSSYLMREAFVRQADLKGKKIADADAKLQTIPLDRYYLISVSATETLSIVDSIPYDTFAKVTTLETDDGQVLKLLLVQPPGNSNPPEAKFFFEKGKGISDLAKTATFKTEFGGNKISKTFDLTKMSWPAPCPGDTAAPGLHRDLDGDYCPVSKEEQKRRDAQTKIVGDDLGLARSISTVLIDKIENKGDPKRTWRVIVTYDATKDNAGADVTARKTQMAKGAGSWSSGNLAVLIFMDPKTQKISDYLGGKDAENIANAKDPAAAAKIFKSGEKKP